MLLVHATGRWVAMRTTALREVNAQLTAAIQEQLAGVRVLRLFGRRAAAIERVSLLSKAQAEANLALIRFRAGLQPAYSTLMLRRRAYRIPQLVNSVQSGAAAFARIAPLFSARASC
jgi:ABC-type multidrug transport system fused ATPase/permease subunit